MSETTARTYIGHAVAILNTENLSLRDKARIFASLAQAEATLEVVDLIKSGVPVSAGSGVEELTTALGQLASRLPDR